MGSFPRICIVSASGQNAFFAEILEALAVALREAGVVVEESVDCMPAPEPDLVYLLIPHEYEPLVHELARPTPLQLRRSIMVCTEQPGNQWFEQTAALAARAGAVVDINELGAAELRRRGVVAEYLPLGYIPAWDVWQGDAERERPIDVTFLGSHTPRRAAALAACAPLLQGLETALHIVESSRPHVKGSSAFLSHERKARLLADTKIVLNVHRDPLGYMEWHRLLSAVVNGAVVISEHSLGIEPFEPGVHYLSAGVESLPEVLGAALIEDGLQRSIRSAAYELVRERMPLSRTTEVLIAAAEKAGSEPFSPLPPAPPSVPLPNPLPEPLADWERHTSSPELTGIRMALKHLVVAQRGLDRRVRELSDPDTGLAEDTIEEFGPRHVQPRVSVLLTVYNYADFVEEALRSVAASELEALEVIAIDDASGDGSSDVIRDTCARLPFLSLKLIRRARNHGLPAARNLAVQHARADLLFVLDADNGVFPRGIGRLADALEADPDAGFAYGLLESFNDFGPVGIMNYLDWDPRRLREGNYIDAMSMLRRSALETVGGFRDDPVLYGWEDFALWMAMAHVGLRGVRVPAFVARYRVGIHSMISLTNVDSSAAYAAMLRRFPSIA